MKILSFDVGIKNLAFCLLETKNNTFNILKWEVINLCNEKNNICKNCPNKAKYLKNNEYYCKLHAKKTNFNIPTINENITKIKKHKLNDLCALACTYDISFNKPITKEKLIELIQEYIKNNYLEEIIEEKTNDYNLIELGINLKIKLDKEWEKMEKLEKMENIDYIIIENQISPLANRMKTLQGMIAQYFIMKNFNNIEFISSTNKLKLFIGNKNTNYNERKKLSIEITNKLLIKNNSELFDIFNKNNKKDDLADCFLQGIYFLLQKETIEKEIINI